MLDKFRGTIKRYNLISEKDTILAGVSGGPDSLALLYALYAIKEEFDLKLYVAHLDHGLRKDSSFERKFVEDTCRKLKLVCISEKVNLKKQPCRGSLEEAGRNARLAFLFKAAQGIKADKIALGHNLDDQAETVLMRIIRGAGLYGLSAILPKRMVCGYTLIRPLIETKRKDIEAFLKKKKIKPRIDKSNFSEVYLRNKIRHSLVPLLEKEYNPKIKEVLSNVAITSGLDYDYLLRRAESLVKHPKAGINLKRFAKLHCSMQRLILRIYIGKAKGNLRRINFQHIAEIEDLAAHRPEGAIVDLPQGVSVIKKRNSLHFFKRMSE